MTATIYTGPMSYTGPDRINTTQGLNATIGERLAPGYNMMITLQGMGPTEDVIEWYIREYQKILESVPQYVWDELLVMPTITFVGPGHDGQFCYLNQLVMYIYDRFGIIYGGWR